jgi:lipid-binding SYLF domain-containing protein
MKKWIGLMMIAGVVSAPMAARAADASSMHKLDQRMDSAATTLEEIESVKLKAVPDWIASKAQCVAVVPGLIKGAFIIGAEYGQGVASCRTPHGWSAPVFIRMAGGSWGFQFGGKGTDLVLVAMNQKGMNDLLKSRFEIGAGASAAAGPVGRTANAATNIGLNSELLSYSRSHGAFLGADLKGVEVSQNIPDTIALYGGKYNSLSALLNGKVTPPNNTAAQHFVHVLNKYFAQARAMHGESTSSASSKEH